MQTTQEFATNLCKKYQYKVRGLSGNGMQIAPSATDPDRGCKVACQDEYLPHRFYLVNGEQGFFPFGTKCTRNLANDNRYCVNGKCIQFDESNIPLVDTQLSLTLYRSRRSTNEFNTSQKADSIGEKRINKIFLYYQPIDITERVTKDSLQSIFSKLHFTNSSHRSKTSKDNSIY